MEDELPPQRRNVALDGEEKVRDVLVGAGLTEIITYTMVDIVDDARTRADKIAPDPVAYVKVLNPLAADRAHLRRSLLPGQLNTARANLRFTDRVTTFEVGRVFYPRPGETLPAEPRRSERADGRPARAAGLAAARRRIAGLLRSEGRGRDAAGPAGGEGCRLGARRASGDPSGTHRAAADRWQRRGRAGRIASGGARRVRSAERARGGHGARSGCRAGGLGRGRADGRNLDPAGHLRGSGGHRGRERRPRPRWPR